MSEADKEKWDAKYRSATHPSFEPSRVLVSVAPFLPETGTALDLAGGSGRHALWLAKRGLDVTLVDVSPVALAIANVEAKKRSLAISALEVDLETQPIPAGPWDLALSVLFLDKRAWLAAAAELRPGGTLVVIQPTVENLQRHPKPPRRFLLEERELNRMIPEFDIVHYREDWLDDGRHDALLVARKK